MTAPTEAQSLRDAVAMTRDEIENRIACLLHSQPDMSGRQINRIHGERRRQVEDLASDIGAHIAKIEADRDAAEAQNEALHAKLAALAPHGSCACSYDTPGDVCSHHSPQVATLTAERDAARATNRDLHRRMQAVEGPLQAEVVRLEQTSEFWLRQRKRQGAKAASAIRQVATLTARLADLEAALDKDENETRVSLLLSLGECGSLRVRSLDLPGLILSARDHAALEKEIGPAVFELLKLRGEWPR